MANTIKTYDLRSKDKTQLEDLLNQFRQELSQLRVQQANRPSLPQIKTVRKNIARVLTVINEQHRDQVIPFYKGRKYQPKDMRGKKTRQLRRALTKNEMGRVTERQRKRLASFPARRYAIKL